MHSHVLGLGMFCLLYSVGQMFDSVVLDYLAVHPYALNACSDCVLFLFATIDPPSEGEEGYEGEAFAGEEQEEPGTTGKPPLPLASFTPILLAYALVAKIAFLFLWQECIRHTETTLIYHPSGCSLSVAPIIQR